MRPLLIDVDEPILIVELDFQRYVDVSPELIGCFINLDTGVVSGEFDI